MAAVHYSPPTTEIEDSAQTTVTYREAALLFKRTPYAPSPGTIARWVAEANRVEVTIPVQRDGRRDRVSWTLLLREHKRRTAERLRAAAAR
ncbi:hypothetical protein ACWC09_26635 [Streptomyces sp. NPDC001617]